MRGGSQEGARALWGAALGTGLVLTLVAAPAETHGWRETARSNGVVVAERSAPEQRVPTFRAIGLVEADLSTVLGVIREADRHPEWLEDCVGARVLAQENESVSYIYHRTDVPWPLADRDVILRTEVDVVEPGRLVFVRFRSAPDKAPLVSGVVRVATLEGFYRLEALAGRRTSVEYRVTMEPAGRVPTWIQRRATRSIPLGTVLGLQRQSMLVTRESPVVVAAESEGAVGASAAARGVASDRAAAPPKRGKTVTSFAPETSATEGF